MNDIIISCIINKIPVEVVKIRLLFSSGFYNN